MEIVATTVAPLESIPGKLPAKPFHFRTVTRRLLRDNDMNPRGSAKNSGESLNNAVRSANHGRRFGETRVGLVQPSGKSDSAGDTVQLRDGQSVFREQEVGPYH